MAPIIYRASPEIESRQKEKLARFKSARSAGTATKSLAKLERATKGSGNLVPAIQECVESNATLGEISDTLRKIFGEHKEKIVL